MTNLPGAVHAPVIALALALSLAGCANPFSSSGTEDDLEDARRTWSQKRISSYTLTVSQSCFCVEEARGPFRVVVSNGAVVSVTDPASGAPRGASEFVPLTVEALFDRVQQAIDNDDELDVRYDPDLGYPREVEINLSQQPVDGGVTIEASGLEPAR